MYLKQGDLAPPLRVDTNADLTGATAVAKIRRLHDDTTMTKNLTITDAPNGIAEYQWQAGDTDTAGTYHVEAVVTFAGGSIQTFPQRSYLEITIRPRV